MNILCIGDVCGEIGLRAVERLLPGLREELGVDACIINGENADVMGLRPEQAWRLYDAGADAVTLGNHLFKRGQILSELKDNPFLIRPYNLGPHIPGPGYRVLEIAGTRLCVVNLLGRLNCEWNADSPFTALEEILREAEADAVAVDFHAEATSEKGALACAFDGRVAVVFGTHTHVQTADERILPGGTGFITDVGMAGAVHSILGVRSEQSVARFLGHPPQHYRTPEDGPAKLEGALFRVEGGRCAAVERVAVGVDL
jgi:metallophosphoesterase (TIGR00282 family)